MSRPVDGPLGPAAGLGYTPGMGPKEIVRLYHGQQMSLRQVARAVGLSAERVRQMLEASGHGTRKRKREGLMATTQPTSLRLSADARRMLEDLEAWLGLKRSAVMELAI